MQLDLLTPAIQMERIAHDAGIATAAANADRRSAGWTARALDFFRDYAATATGPLMTEDVRLAATAAGLPEPPDGRAWGAVALAASRKRIIKRIGYGPQRAAGCHMAPKSIWRRA